jgi:hypothetical protein
MTVEEQRVFAKWKRRANLFRQAYHKAVANEVDARLELKLKLKSERLQEEIELLTIPN